MSAPRWTPGPWIFDPETGAVFSKDGRVCDLDVCSSISDDDIRDETSRLIAAAPAMAEYIRKRAETGDSEASEIWRGLDVNT